MSRDTQIAKNVNGGVCMFCGGELLKCDEEGDCEYPTENWVSCEYSSCQTGAINASNYNHPLQCADKDSCPHFEDWHQSICDDDCDKGDCDSCDRIDPDDCESSDETDTDTLADDLLEAVKSYREEDGRFVENTIEDIRKKITEIAESVRDNEY